MRRALSILIIGLMFFTTFSVTFHVTTSGNEGSDNGCIYGYTYQTIGWETFPTPFVHVQAGGKHDISDIFGYYELNDLPLNQVYELTANKVGYVGEHVTVELTSEEPEVEVNILLTLKNSSPQPLTQKNHLFN